MIFFRLILKEVLHRKVNFLLSVLAVVLAVGLYVAFTMMGKASANETRKIMLELGQNLRIIPKDTEMDEFWITGFSEATMPQDYIYRFAEKSGYSYTHLTATLHQKIKWRDKTVILTGVMPEVFPPDKSFQKPMTFTVKPGTAYIGGELASSLQVHENDEIEIADRKLKVIKTLSFKGSIDDIRIYCHLDDAQKILNLPGRINEIKALECMCYTATDTDPLTAAQEQLKDLLPEGRVLLLDTIAQIRIKQRTSTQKHMNFIMSCTFIGCGVMIGILAMVNVRDRKAEIGLLQVLGYQCTGISLLFLGKALLTGITGAIVGFFVGTKLALMFGADIFPVTAKAISVDSSLLNDVLLWTPAFVIVASFLPIIIAATNDPAMSLRED
jgi:ABC-type lipoprotein release transport system permease subunit